MKLSSKPVDVMKLLEEALEPRVNQALARAVTFNECEISKVQNWALKVKPMTVSEKDFIKNISYDMTRIRRGDKIIRVSLNPCMNVVRGANEEGDSCYGIPLKTVETAIQNLLSAQNKVGWIASYEEAEFLRAYKVATRCVSLGTICESNRNADSPREFYAASTSGYSFTGGRGHSFVYEYFVASRIITILPGDLLVITIKNGY